jgi:hypothetical protein
MSGNQETIDGQDKRRIAVIAFHGVADQKPRETAQAIAMLLGLRDDNRVRIYSDFKESELRLPVEPVFEPPGLREASPDKTSWKDYFKIDPHTELFKGLHKEDKGKRLATERIKQALANNQPGFPKMGLITRAMLFLFGPRDTVEYAKTWCTHSSLDSRNVWCPTRLIS